MSLTAERLDRIQPSLTIAISTVARKMIADGKNVISLSQGEPDFDTPRNIKDAAIRALEAGETKYTDVSGTQVLRRAVAAKFKRDSGIDYQPEEIIISTGAAYSAEDLKPICEVLMRHPHVWVLTDDIYDGLVYGGFKAGTIVASMALNSTCLAPVETMTSSGL